MVTLINTKLGLSRGVARFWVEGNELSHSFEPGERFNLDFDDDNRVLTFIKNPNGTNRVSKRTDSKRNIVKPLIEVRDDKLAEFFGEGVALRVTVNNGVAKITVHGSEKKVVERVQRFLDNIKNKSALKIGSVFSGAGVIDAALHLGLKEAGIDSYTKFAVERESKYLSTLVRNQPELFRSDSLLVCSDIHDLELSKASGLDILVAGIPCTGSSKAGRTKNQLSQAEDHEDAGAAFYSLLKVIEHFQPAVIMAECVSEYMNTASFAVIKSMLSRWRYKFEVDVLSGNDFGALENRKRMCFIAYSEGLTADNAGFSFESLSSDTVTPTCVSEILEDIESSDPRWKSYSYLESKEKRDLSDGKGFKRSLYSGSETSVTTIRRQYMKAGSCDQFVVSKTDPSLSRLFTPIEHAKIKGIPSNLHKIIDGLSDSVAHECLGQSVIFPVFQAVGHALGCWFNSVGNQINERTYPRFDSLPVDKVKQLELVT